MSTSAVVKAERRTALRMDTADLWEMDDVNEVLDINELEAGNFGRMVRVPLL